MTATARGWVAADAAAIAVATGVAFVFRAGVRDYDSLAPGHLASLIVPALPLAVPIALLALWAAGLYDRGPARDRSGVLAVAAPLAWAAAVLAFVAASWDKGPEAPFTVMVVGYPAAVACVLTGRYLLGRAPRAAAR